MRIGTGFDMHRLVEGRKLVLGGVEIPHHTGLLGYSDADVLVHAIGDALLGAAALGDLGQHFPDNNPRYHNIDSLILLGEVAQKLREIGFKVVNIDATVVAQEPRLAPHIPLMRERLAACLGLDISQVGIKATTTEGLGPEGRREGISAQAVALIEAL